MKTSLLKNDLKSGFSVFLLALPLCLGIAMASNFPPVAGLISAIVGGLVASFFGSSRLTIKGPAAGLIVIALGAVNDLGQGDPWLGYKRALAVGVVAAILQIILALFKMARIAEIMPPAVIHGMLAAIGIIIIGKQSSVFLGVNTSTSSPLGLIAEIPANILSMNPMVGMIGIISLMIILIWPKIKRLQFIPSSLVVLIVAIPLAFIFNFATEHTFEFLGTVHSIGPKFLINLPSDLSKLISFPDFSSLFSVVSLKYIAMFTLVGSIESLLTVCAVDSLDPDKKKSNLNKDLFATGVGNLISSLIGGLPMISEIVRSKANIDYAAKSIWSNFFHGLLLLLSLVLFPFVINAIPLSALAALLIFTGFRLAAPSEFKHMLEIGKDQFLYFLVTMFVTLLTDLLVGVGVGILLKVFVHIYRGVKVKDFFKLKYEEEINDNEAVVTIKNSLIFSNFLQLQTLLDQYIASNLKIKIIFKQTRVIDHTIQDKLLDYQKNYDVLLIGLDSMISSSKHLQSTKHL